MYKQAIVNNLIKIARVRCSKIHGGNSMLAEIEENKRRARELALQQKQQQRQNFIQKQQTTMNNIANGASYNRQSFPSGPKPTGFFGKLMARMRYGSNWDAMPGWDGTSSNIFTRELNVK